ncbi:MAG: PAS domain-containing sensor histidine kinase [Syntrophobacteria bacterium]
MKNKDKTREQLTEEFEELRRRVTELEAIEARHLTVERVLKQKEQEKQTILDSLVEHVIFHDMEMKVQWANQAACDSVGMTREELLGRHCYELWAKRSDACEDCPVKLARQTGQPQAIEKTTLDGRSWYVQGSPVLDSNGHLLGMVELTLDITQRKRIEEELRASESRYRHLVEAMNEGLGFADRNYNFTFVNQKFCEMLGYSQDELIGREFIQFVHGECREMMKDQMARRKRGEDERFELTWRTKEGRKVYTIASPKGFFDAEGNFTGSLVVLTDITLRRQLEEALRQAHLESKRRMEELVEKRTAELMRANELLQHEIEERKQTEKQVRRLSQEVIKAQEVERQRIAADLHDRLAQDLASLKVGLDTLYADQPDTPDERRQKFSELSGLLEHTLMAVRDKAYGLHPPSLKEFGLAYTVQQYCEEFAGKNSLKVDFFSVGMDDLELDFDTEIAFYRLVQEGLTNIRKHADASHVIVRLSASFSHIMLHIEDNGKGFEVNNRLAAALDERRMGIWSMEQRVAFLHGEMKIESGRMYGTKILIKVPHMDETNG